MEKSEYKMVEIKQSEIRIETTRGTGNGGQHKNTTDSCVVITHLPTGIKVVRDGRSQHKNKEEAMAEITKRVNNYYRTGVVSEEVEQRRSQIGTGFRGDKIRTYTYKNDLIFDHKTGKKASLRQVFKGNLKLLHI
jgi:peptide chain release factor 1